MEKINGCRVVDFGAKPIGFVLEVLYDEERNGKFVIKNYLQKEVEEHLEYEDKVFAELGVCDDASIENIVELAKEKLGENKELMISAAVLHEMEVRRKF